MMNHRNYSQFNKSSQSHIFVEPLEDRRLLSASVSAGHVEKPTLRAALGLIGTTSTAVTSSVLGTYSGSYVVNNAPADLIPGSLVSVIGGTVTASTHVSVTLTDLTGANELSGTLSAHGLGTFNLSGTFSGTRVSFTLRDVTTGVKVATFKGSFRTGNRLIGNISQTIDGKRYTGSLHLTNRTVSSSASTSTSTNGLGGTGGVGVSSTSSTTGGTGISTVDNNSGSSIDSGSGGSSTNLGAGTGGTGIVVTTGTGTGFGIGTTGSGIGAGVSSSGLGGPTSLGVGSGISVTTTSSSAFPAGGTDVFAL